MKITQRIALLSALVCATSSSHAALSIVGNDATPLLISHSSNFAPGWDTSSDGSASNAFIDLDGDGVFGETGIGENVDDTPSGVSINITPSGTTTYNFALEGFGVDPSRLTFTASFDSGTAPILVTVTGAGNTESITDPITGEQWSVSYDFTTGFYGDVVFNTAVGTNGTFANDHQFRLTLTEVVPVPEPSSTLLAGLATLGLLAKRRR